MTTIVHFADLHLDTPFRWAGHEFAAQRRRDLRDTLDAIVQLATDVGADALFCGGDLYEHEMTAPDTAEVIRSAFERLHPVPVLVAPGNHDHLSPRSLYALTTWSPNVHLFRQSRPEPFELAGGLTVWGAAHLVPANTPNLLDGFRVDRSGVNLGLLHASLNSGLPFQEDGKQPHAPFDERDVESAGLDHAFLGHFHRPVDRDRLTYPGNPEPLTFGEDGERGVVIARVHHDGRVTRERRDVSKRQVHDVVVTLDGCASDQEIRQRVSAALVELSGIARVTLRGEVAPDVPLDLPDLRDLAPHLDHVVGRFGDVRIAYDIDVIAGETGTVRGQFVRDVLDDPSLDDEIRRRVLITGLRALDGRRDLEVH